MTEIVTKGLSLYERKFQTTCDVCDCEFKFCLDVIEIFRTDPQRYVVSCPHCRERCDVEDVVGKYLPMIFNREDYD